MTFNFMITYKLAENLKMSVVPMNIDNNIVSMWIKQSEFVTSNCLVRHS